MSPQLTECSSSNLLNFLEQNVIFRYLRMHQKQPENLNTALPLDAMYEKASTEMLTLSSPTPDKTVHVFGSPS